MAQILIVDDDKLMHATIRSIFDGDEITSCYSIDDAKKAMAAKTFSVAFLDIQLTNSPQREGIELLEHIIDLDSYLPCVMMSGLDDKLTIEKCLELGALDYVIKGIASPDVFRLAMFKSQVWRKLISESTSKRHPLTALHHSSEIDSMIGNSKVMAQVKETIKKLGVLDGPFLILGATGTGKELAAKALWSMKGNRNRPFIAINCASLPANLVESELFGYEKGAFTGAVTARTGLFEAASGGDIFLDEIGELSLELQAKLLRVLQEKKVRRLGSDKERAVDFRVIAATNVGLLEAVADKSFREDLFYRLNVHPLQLPELKLRNDDIMHLLKHFLSFHSFNNVKFQKEVEQKLLSYNWPGNIRQLRALSEYLRAYLDPKAPELTMDVLDQWFSFNAPSPKSQSILSLDPTAHLKGAQETKSTVPIVEILEKIQRQYVDAALKITNQNRSQAANLLGVSRQRFSNWLNDWQIF